MDAKGFSDYKHWIHPPLIKVLNTFISWANFDELVMVGLVSWTNFDNLGLLIIVHMEGLKLNTTYISVTNINSLFVCLSVGVQLQVAFVWCNDMLHSYMHAGVVLHTFILKK